MTTITPFSVSITGVGSSIQLGRAMSVMPSVRQPCTLRKSSNCVSHTDALPPALARRNDGQTIQLTPLLYLVLGLLYLLLFARIVNEGPQ